ncbi:MAG TPA: sensor domain-containing diguanylate cyclase, partial [Polyangiaceae bacterium]|nr:sensor domain-containing diguanylate cyclase [Polyangiaceae bacterium]
RATLAIQQALNRASGLVLSFGLGIYLVYWAAGAPAPFLSLLAAGVLLASTTVRLLRRWRGLFQANVRRLDLELFTHLVVLAYALVLRAPGGLQGPFYSGVYALMMLAAAFSEPIVAFATLAFAVVLEAAVVRWAFGVDGSLDLYAHSVLLTLFTVLNMSVFRAEIARVRKLSRLRIESEIERMKEAARSYRLLGAPSSPSLTTTGDRRVMAPKDDEARLLRSGVDEIHHALQFALGLLRRSLGLRTAVLLGLDSTRTKLHVQELSTDHDAINPGPFRAQDSIFGAVLSQGAPVSLCGAKAGQHVTYYARKPAIGAVCAIPALEHGQPRGVLVVDREAPEAFSAGEQELLAGATRFILRAIENERLFVQLERAKSEQGKLYRAAELLAAATTEAGVIDAAVSSAREFAAFDFAAFTLFDRGLAEHEICAVSGSNVEGLLGQRFRHNSGLVSMVVANRHPLPYRGDYDRERQVVFTRRLTPPSMPSLLVLPLLVHDRALGTLVLGSERRAAFGDAVRPTLEVLASHIAVSLANARMLKRLEELATTDGLTGLLNKRSLGDVAVQKIKSASRFRKPLSVLVCDIDHFKKVNDTHGHDVGDVVIRGFADVLRKVKRDTDVVGRFGGEEFVVVCEETDERGALQLAERIRSELEASSFKVEGSALRVTCSLGVATFPGAGQTWDTLFKATDEALYVSKRGGRNRATAWSPKLSGCAA